MLFFIRMATFDEVMIWLLKEIILMNAFRVSLNCKLNNMRGMGFYKCSTLFHMIQVRYQGPNLVIFSEKNQCNSNPCQHNGKCEDAIDDYKCNCTNPYGGSSCQFGRFYFNIYIYISGLNRENVQMYDQDSYFINRTSNYIKT